MESLDFIPRSTRRLCRVHYTRPGFLFATKSKDVFKKWVTIPIVSPRIPINDDFFFLENKTGRTYDSSEDMELVTNIILNPSYAENDRTLLTNEGHNDRQALLKCNRNLVPRPVCLWTFICALSNNLTLSYIYDICPIVAYTEFSATPFSVLVKFFFIITQVVSS